METRKVIAKANLELEDQTNDNKILSTGGFGNPPVPNSYTSEDVILSKADRIRGVTRSLVMDALAVMDRMWEDCQQPPALRENYYLLYHYLDYLKRFSEGRV